MMADETPTPDPNAPAPPRRGPGRPKGSKDSYKRLGPHPDHAQLAAPPRADGKKRGRPPLTQAERATRQKLILARRLTNHYVDEIAEEFRISKATVNRELAKARREGHLDAAANYISDVLMPKALAVYAKELDSGNVEVADKVLEFCGFGQKGGQSPVMVQVNTGSGQPQEDFDAFRLSLAKRRLGGPVIDAETVPAADSRVPPGGDAAAVDGELPSDGAARAEVLGAATDPARVADGRLPAGEAEEAVVLEPPAVADFPGCDPLREQDGEGAFLAGLDDA